MSTVQQKMQSIIDKANTITGKNDNDLTKTTQSLIDGFGGGTDTSIGSRFWWDELLLQKDYATNLFSGTKIEELSDLNLLNAVGIDLICNNCQRLKKINKINAPKAKKANYSFQNCANLSEIVLLDIPSCTSLRNSFTACKSLKILNIEKDTLQAAIDLSPCPHLETIDSIINGLANISKAQTITFNQNIVLSDEQKAQIQSKGWTLAQ